MAGGLSRDIDTIARQRVLWPGYSHLVYRKSRQPLNYRYRVGISLPPCRFNAGD